MKVHVITDTELGWDCVVAVFSGKTREELRAEFPQENYVIIEMYVETKFYSDLDDDIEDDD
jgi:hypothetical protein